MLVQQIVNKPKRAQTMGSITADAKLDALVPYVQPEDVSSSSIRKQSSARRYKQTCAEWQAITAVTDFLQDRRDV